MSDYVHGMLMNGDDLALLAQMFAVIEQHARRAGNPLSDNLVRLKRRVDAAIDTERTLTGLQESTAEYRWVTTTEYAKLTGRCERTARRYAAKPGVGRFDNGRWMIPIRK